MDYNSKAQFILNLLHLLTLDRAASSSVESLCAYLRNHVGNAIAEKDLSEVYDISCQSIEPEDLPAFHSSFDYEAFAKLVLS